MQYMTAEPTLYSYKLHMGAPSEKSVADCLCNQIVISLELFYISFTYKCTNAYVKFAFFLTLFPITHKLCMKLKKYICCVLLALWYSSSFERKLLPWVVNRNQFQTFQSFLTVPGLYKNVNNKTVWFSCFCLLDVRLCKISSGWLGAPFLTLSLNLAKAADKGWEANRMAN